MNLLYLAKKSAYGFWWITALFVCVILSIAIRLGLPDRTVGKWLGIGKEK